MKKIVWIIVAILLVGGVTYFHMSNAVAKDIQGHTYKYQSVGGDKFLYVTFAPESSKVVVNPSKGTALDAGKSQSAFNKGNTPTRKKTVLGVTKHREIS